MKNIKPASSKVVLKLPAGGLSSSKINFKLDDSKNANLDKSILDKSKDGVSGYMEARKKQ